MPGLALLVQEAHHHVVQVDLCLYASGSEDSVDLLHNRDLLLEEYHLGVRQHHEYLLAQIHICHLTAFCPFFPLSHGDHPSFQNPEDL
jgi:hypothetical protein